MIVVRNVFRIAPGKMKEAKEVAKAGRAVAQNRGMPEGRLLTDVTGEFYTLVLENTFENLSAFESGLQNIFGDPEWQSWYARLTPLVASGYREIFTVVE